MPEREFNRVLEIYLVEGSMTPKDYEEMSELQQYVIQAIKRARSRLRRRQNETEN